MRRLVIGWPEVPSVICWQTPGGNRFKVSAGAEVMDIESGKRKIGTSSGLERQPGNNNLGCVWVHPDEDGDYVEIPDPSDFEQTRKTCGLTPTEKGT